MVIDHMKCNVFPLYVGAFLVTDKTFLSQGWNRMSKGCESLPWSRQANTILGLFCTAPQLITLHLHTIHRHRNAILNGFKKGLKGKTVYNTLFRWQQVCQDDRRYGYCRVHVFQGHIRRDEIHCGHWKSSPDERSQILVSASIRMRVLSPWLFQTF